MKLQSKFPADNLTGVKLESGWSILDKIPPSETSGKYSTCYRVKKQNGDQGFLKAFDYRDLSKAGAREKHDRVYNRFKRERDLLIACNEKNIEGVVSIVESGEIFLGSGRADDRVDYFILEYSEDGNLSDCLKKDKLTNLVQILEAIKDVFDTLNDLHYNKIMHLDLKPANLLHFVNERWTKITDFGSARRWLGDIQDDLKEDEDRIITTRAYAPPEVLYNSEWTDKWNEHRKKIDLYLAGNLIVVLFTNISYTALLFDHLAEWDRWQNNRNVGKLEELLPNLISASASSLVRVRERILDINIECGNPLDENDIDSILGTVSELCTPDPNLRGHPKDLRTITESHGLDRYRDNFIRIARKINIQVNQTYKTERN